MPKILVLRSLPASGKSTYARNWVAASPSTRVRSNRDEVREMMTGKRYGLSFEEENLVTDVCHALVVAALKAGKDVVVDDTHLRPKYIKPWQKLAHEMGAELEIHKMPILPLEELVLRDDDRAHSVGQSVITHMYKTFLKKGDYLPITPYAPKEDQDIQPYKANPNRPKAVIVDIDGTLALNTTGRGWFDWDKVGDDTPFEAVVGLVRQLMQDPDITVIFMSGRDEVCRDITTEWIRTHLGVYPEHLHMRLAGDTRPDTVAKLELFNLHVRDDYNVSFVLDDRPSVCRMWRKLGLTVLQVGDPHVEF